MSNSTAKRKSEKDFPLWQRHDGRWCRKIRGRVFYFGTDKQEALDEWLRVKDYRLAGKEPPPKDAPEALTLESLVNAYLAAKKADVDAEVLTSRTFQGAFFSCEKIVGFFGRCRLVSDISQNDFAKYRSSLVNRKYSANTVNLEIARCKAIFNWAYETELIDRQLRYGPQFKTSKKSTRRQNGKTAAKMFEPSEIKALIDAASTQLRAMIWLGVNAGFGNIDCSELPKASVDLKGGWCDHPRPKTGVYRRVALWPETVQALQEAIAARPEPKNVEDSGLVFITTYGNHWVRMEPSKTGKVPRWQDAVTLMFRLLVNRIGLSQKGRGFYTFRRVFRTIADETNDWPAVNLAMGHTDPTIGGVYRQMVTDERLRRVADHVHSWLFAEGGAK